MCGRKRASKRLLPERVYNPRTQLRRVSLTFIKKTLLVGTGLLGSMSAVWLYAQDRPVFRVKVDMVVLSFTVTDSKGHYVNGLKPKDFRITEDGILQKLATFAEGNKPPVQVAEDGSIRGLTADVEAPGGGRSDAFV